MYINGFDNIEDIERQFNVDDKELTDVTLLYAIYTHEDYEGNAFVLFTKNNVLYEVHGSHCSCHGLEDQWSPEETSIEDLARRYLDSTYRSNLFKDDKDWLEIKRVLMGELFDQQVFH